MKSIFFIALVGLLIFMGSCNQLNQSTQKDAGTIGANSVLETRKAFVKRYMEQYATSAPADRSEVGGVKVLENLSFLTQSMLRELNGESEIEVVRLLADDNAVFAQTAIRNNGDTYISFDLFLFENEKKVERWNALDVFLRDVLDEKYALSGPREPEELEKTASNKEIIREFTQLGFIDFVPKHQLYSFLVGEDLIYHDVQGEDGFQAFINDIPMYGMITDEPVEDLSNVLEGSILKIMGVGNWVVGATKLCYRESALEVIRINLYRLEDGKIVEVWSCEDSLEGYDD